MKEPLQQLINIFLKLAQVVPGAPSPFDPYTFYPALTTAWGANNIAPIRQLSNALNWTLFILSVGGLDLNKLRATNFVVDTSKYPDRILTIVVKIAIQIFRLIYNVRTPIQDKEQRIQILKNVVMGLPDGSTNTYINSKIGGNPKTVLLNIIAQIK